MVKLMSILFVNLITTIRIIGVLCLLPIYLNYGGIAAAILSICCYLTDIIDGVLARKLQVSTFFGSMFDAVADKLFTISNLVVLVTITKYAWIPIFFEVAIVIVSIIKFSKNANIQSTEIGKIKTWIIGLTVIILYLVTDIKNLTILSTRTINTINLLNINNEIGYLFIPLYIFEFLTLLSYLKIPKSNEKNPEIKLDIKFKPGTCFKNKFDNFCTLWLNHDFYLKYKDSAGLKQIRKHLKENR